MAKEVTARAATIDEAVEKAVAELGAKREDCAIEVLETPRKSLFGKMKEAVVKVSCELIAGDCISPRVGTTTLPHSSNDMRESLHEVAEDWKAAVEGSIDPAPTKEAPVRPGKAAVSPDEKIAVATAYLNEIFASMGLAGVEQQVEEKEEGATITLVGDGLAVLIGHHGETLDSLQYLVALACNRIGGDYYRITLDCGNYREKREATLQSLATRIAQKVKKSGRSQLLEPMNPYERRIIHSVVSTIDGVTSKSKGEEPNRRVVILSERPSTRSGGNSGGYAQSRDRGERRPPAPRKRELTMEEILKGEFKEEFREREESAELYSKIEL